MDNLILVAILVVVGVVIAYKKVPAVQEFIDSKLFKKTQKPVEAPTKPVETTLPPVNTPVATTPETPAVEPVKQPERAFAEMFSAYSHKPTMNTINTNSLGTGETDLFSKWPVGLPGIIAFSAKKNSFPMYFRVPIPTFVNTTISIGADWDGSFTMTMIPHPNITQPHATITWDLKDFSGKVLAEGHGDTAGVGAIKFISQSKSKIYPRYTALPAGNYSLTIHSSSVDSYFLMAPTEA